MSEASLVTPGERSAQAGSGAGGNHLAPPGGPPINRVYEHAGGAHIECLYEWLAADAERGPDAVDRSEERSHDPADLARAETPDLSTSPQHQHRNGASNVDGQVGGGDDDAEQCECARHRIIVIHDQHETRESAGKQQAPERGTL